MARYKLTLAYDGTDFQGSQRQLKSRTVQGELEKALHTLDRETHSVVMAGRTDTGVHASGQVAAVNLDWQDHALGLQKALNSLLPADLAVRKIEEIDAVFHPRFDAVTRGYAYQIIFAPFRSPLLERHAWRLWPELDGCRLNETAGFFIGTFDFAAFGSPTSPKGGTVRKILKSAWEKKSYSVAGITCDGWEYTIQGDAFLYRMVRRVVFSQVAVAQGRISMERIHEAIMKKKTLPAGLAPAHGLTLVEVAY